MSTRQEIPKTKMMFPQPKHVIREVEYGFRKVDILR